MLDAIGKSTVNADFKKQKTAGIPKNKFEVYLFPKDPTNGKGVVGQAVFVAGFNNISGLDADIEQINWTTGDSEVEIKLPGKISHSNITMEKGFDDQFILREWFNQRGHAYSKSDNYMLDIGIVVKSASGEPARLILVSNAWLSKYKPGDLQSDSMDPWVEGIEISHEGWAFGNDSGLPSKDGVTTYDFSGKGDIVNLVSITGVNFFKTDV